MKYNNRLYPHPVLGILDDINGIFNCNLSVEADKDYIILKPSFNLSNKDLENLLITGEAKICVHVYCRGTLFRQNYVIHDYVSDEIRIASTSLNGETEVDFFICSAKENSDYRNSSVNPIFGLSKFYIEEGDILAYGGKGKFFANKSPEQLKAVSSIMRIKKAKFKNGPFYNEYEDKHIVVNLSEEDFEIYLELKENRNFVNILHASIVVPALMEAVYFIGESEASNEFKESEWCKILEDSIESIKGNTILEKIQEMLDLPLNREFLSLSNFEYD
jgi:hypothetical protein